MRHNFILAIACLCLSFFICTCNGTKENALTDPDIEEEPDPDVIEPCIESRINYPASITSDPDPMIESNDLTIGWITRLPKIDYVPDSGSPDIEGWPLSGQEVTWRAYIKNWSDSTKTGIAYQWLLNDAVVDSGRTDLAPGVFSTLDYKWNWTFDRHEVTLRIDADSGDSNKLSIYTDAISLGLYVERGLYEYFHENQSRLGIGSNSFEGWAQRQVRFYNELFKRAVYDETPNGVLDRIRIDNISIVEDGTLPLVAPSDNKGFDPRQAKPNLNDRTVDLQWGFPAEFVQSGAYSNHTWLNFDNQFYYSGFLQHELGHARYLIDVYGFDLNHGVSLVDIKENGQPIAGTRYLPGETTIVNGVQVLELHETLEKGLMNSQWRYMDRYSAIAMNLIKGHRATKGNYNGAENEGLFLNDLPRENRFKIKDRNGKLLKKTRVQVFQSSLNNQLDDAAYPKYFDDVPDLEFESDANAQVLLGQNPFSKAGGIEHEWQVFSNALFIMRVEFENKVGYTIVEVSQFNLEYWRGNTDMADYEVCVPLF